VPAHRARGDLAIAARDVLQRRCAACHSGSADPGKSRLALLDHARLTAKGRPVPAVELLLDLVKDGSMPPGNRAAPTAAEIAALEAWAKAGAPEFPAAFDDAYVLRHVAADIERELPRNKLRYAGEYLRYASFAHLIRDGDPLPNVEALEARLNAAVSFATSRPEKLVAVDPVGLVFRIDLTRLNWRGSDLFARMTGAKAEGTYTGPASPFDLVLLEYPFAIRSMPGATTAPPLARYLSADNQVRPVPYVRGEWLAAALVRGKNLTPLAQDMKSLAALTTALGRAEPPPVGHDARPLAGARAVAGPVPPLAALYASDVAPDPTPFALTVEVVANGKPVAKVTEDAPYKLRATADRAVRFVLLKVLADGELRVQQVEGGDALRAKESRELSPGGDGFATGPETLGFFLFACTDELPAPLVLRSRHADKHVWRFLLEPSAKFPFDPGAVVRKWVPVPVGK
jgi:hypothetical protein